MRRNPESLRAEHVYLILCLKSFSLAPLASRVRFCLSGNKEAMSCKASSMCWPRRWESVFLLDFLLEMWKVTTSSPMKM